MLKQTKHDILSRIVFFFLSIQNDYLQHTQAKRKYVPLLEKKIEDRTYLYMYSVLLCWPIITVCAKLMFR